MVGAGPCLVYFGRKWDAPLFDSGMWIKVVVPVDWQCVFCDEPIGEEDFGLFIHAVMSMFPARQLVPIHFECQLRNVAGNVDHLEGRCGCWHGPQEPHVKQIGQTYRDEARAVVAWFNARRAMTGMGPL